MTGTQHRGTFCHTTERLQTGLKQISKPFSPSRRCPGIPGHPREGDKGFEIPLLAFRVHVLWLGIGRKYSAHVERRGKPPTRLPRQKLAEERIPSATTTIENFLLTRIKIFEKNRKFSTLHVPTYFATFHLPRELQSS